MKRIVIILLASVALVLLMVMLVPQPKKAVRDELKGHSRQAFFRHVGMVLLARNPFIKESSKIQKIKLGFVDEMRISEFSELSNIVAVYLLCEGGKQLSPQLIGIGAPWPMSTVPAGRVYEAQSGMPLYMRSITLGIDPSAVLDEAIVTNIQFSFADGLVEDFPVGRFRLKRIPDEQVLVGAAVSWRFLLQRGTLAYEGKKYQLNDAPQGMCINYLALRVQFPENSVDNGYGIGSGSRLLDVDIGIDGLSVDWAHPFYLEAMKQRAVVDQAVQKEFAKLKEEEPDLEWNADSYYNAILSVTDRHRYSSEEIEVLDPSLFLPEDFYTFKRDHLDCEFSEVAEPPTLPRDIDGIPSLEVLYPVYYDPNSDFSNTFIFFQPLIAVASGDSVKYRFARFTPTALAPASYADLGALLDAQNQ